MKTIQIRCGSLAIMTTIAWAAYANEPGMDTIQKKLESEYHITKTNDDKTDIVTAGSVVVLHKDKVLMFAVSATVNPCMNTYRDGKITANLACRLAATKSPHSIPGRDKLPAARYFVDGEKFWVTKIDVKDAGKERGVVIDFFTDATPAGDQGIRYKGVLTVPLGAATRTPDDALKLVAEVITVVPPEEDAKKDGGSAKNPEPQGIQQDAAPASQPAPCPTPVAAEAPMAPIEPPPPPAPVMVSEGQTIEQVVAILGHPVNIANVGNKVVYTYKVVFVNDKVTAR